MKTKTTFAAALVGALALTTTAFAQSTRWDELSKLPFKDNYCTLNELTRALGRGRVRELFFGVSGKVAPAAAGSPVTPPEKTK